MLKISKSGFISIPLVIITYRAPSEFIIIYS